MGKRKRQLDAPVPSAQKETMPHDKRHMCPRCGHKFTRKDRARTCCPTLKTTQRSSSRSSVPGIRFGSVHDAYEMEVKNTRQKAEPTQRTVEEERTLARDIREQTFAVKDQVYVRSNKKDRKNGYKWYRATIVSITGKKFVAYFAR